MPRGDYTRPSGAGSLRHYHAPVHDSALDLARSSARLRSVGPSIPPPPLFPSVCFYRVIMLYGLLTFFALPSPSSMFVASGNRNPGTTHTSRFYYYYYYYYLILLLLLSLLIFLLFLWLLSLLLLRGVVPTPRRSDNNNNANGSTRRAGRAPPRRVGPRSGRYAEPQPVYTRTTRTDAASRFRRVVAAPLRYVTVRVTHGRPDQIPRTHVRALGSVRISGRPVGGGSWMGGLWPRPRAAGDRLPIRRDLPATDVRSESSGPVGGRTERLPVRISLEDQRSARNIYSANVHDELINVHDKIRRRKLIRPSAGI